MNATADEEGCFRVGLLLRDWISDNIANQIDVINFLANQIDMVICSTDQIVFVFICALIDVCYGQVSASDSGGTRPLA